MISGKHITGVITAITALAAVLCLGAAALISGGSGGLSQEYETELFDTSEIISVNIIMDESSFQELLDTAIDETYFKCDAEINGTTFHNIGIRAKGNTSLSSVYNDPDTERYSFKLEFDRYVSGQTCFGLDKLVLNNNYADATGMKEALVYDMFAFLGADASLYNYAKISVNGEYWGLYLALEAVEDSFLLRSYGLKAGQLYKPEGVVGGGRDAGVSGGADLNYAGDSLSDYETIWDGAVTDSTDSDHRRVITALEHASSGEELERYLDVDNLLRYMAVHEFCVNEDSLSGAMAHNYYLYESGGALNIIPWDYNLAFGGMGMDDAQSVINDPVDSPFSITEFFDALLDNEEYLARYHEYLRMLCEEYVLGGAAADFFERERSLIDGLVETDPTAFYGYDEYAAAVEMLQSTVRLRAQSVLGQLDGSVPSTDSAQRENADLLISADGIDLSVMGTMNTGGPGGNAPDFGGELPSPDGGISGSAGDAPGAPDLGSGVSEQTADKAFSPPSGGTENAEGSDPGAGMPDKGGAPGNFGGAPGGFGGPPNGFGDTAPEGTGEAASLAYLAASAVIMLAALIFALLYRRRPRRR